MVLVVHLKFGQKIEILKVQPSHDSPANKIASCVKGKFSWGHINSDQRITKPLVRKDGAFHEVEWEEALQVMADNFNNIKDQHGADSFVIYFIF